LGRVERRLRLKGSVEVPGGAKGEPWLCLAATGAWLLVPEARVAVGPTPPGPIDARADKRGFRLRFGELEVRVPSKASREALEILGVAKVRADRGTVLAPPPAGPCIVTPGPVEQALLAAWLHPDEPLLAFLPTATTEPMTSWALRDAHGTVALAVTPDRVARFTVTPVGDVAERPLDGAAVSVSADGARARVGTRELDTKAHQEKAARLGELLTLPPTERLLECALFEWLARKSKGNLAGARVLLAAASRRGDPRGALLSFMLGTELSEPAAALPEIDFDALAALPHGGRALRELWERWQLSVPTGAAVVGQRSRAAVTLDLHAAVNEARARGAVPIDAALGDIDLAEHALDAKAPDLARRVLEHRLEALAVRPLEQLEPQSAASAARVATRTRILQLLLRARGEPDTPHAGTLRQLAMAEPLSTPRLEAVAEHVPAPFGARAAEALTLLQSPPVSESADAAPRPTRAWTDDELRTLRGDAPSDLGARLGALQRVLALPVAPERSQLMDFCEAVPRGAPTPMGRALSAAATLLDVQSVDAFVSRGRLATGCRAFEAAPPIVLVGGRHVTPGDALCMSESALTFALTAELAHVRFDHGRVTPDQVWEGALSRSHQGLEFLLTVVPTLRAVSTARGVGKVAAQLDSKTVRRAVDGAEKLNDAIRQALVSSRAGQTSPEGLGTSNEKLIEAHRYLQLGADRAGLAACGSLTAAVSALFATRARYADGVTAMPGASVLDLLRTRTTEGDAAFADLALRLAGLVAFYLSDEFSALSEDVRGDVDV
jgi:hypothetical protein